jgi:hypothetical protein
MYCPGGAGATATKFFGGWTEVIKATMINKLM